MGQKYVKLACMYCHLSFLCLACIAVNFCVYLHAWCVNRLLIRSVNTKNHECNINLIMTNESNNTPH